MTKELVSAATTGDLFEGQETPENCRRCDLWKYASQAVVGAGLRQATLLLVGEQPGDEEDKRGLPFVGPAGKVLDHALETAGIERGRVFITNAVKHFKFETRGKRRLHKKPELREINACHVWLERELEDIHPRVIVALGGTALRAVLGKTLAVETSRALSLTDSRGIDVVATYHPSAILRAEGGRTDVLRSALVEDLKRAWHLAER